MWSRCTDGQNNELITIISVLLSLCFIMLSEGQIRMPSYIYIYKHVGLMFRKQCIIADHLHTYGVAFHASWLQRQHVDSEQNWPSTCPCGTPHNKDAALIMSTDQVSLEPIESLYLYLGLTCRAVTFSYQIMYACIDWCGNVSKHINVVLCSDTFAKNLGVEFSYY